MINALIGRLAGTSTEANCWVMLGRRLLHWAFCNDRWLAEMRGLISRRGGVCGGPQIFVATGRRRERSSPEDQARPLTGRFWRRGWRGTDRFW